MPALANRSRMRSWSAPQMELLLAATAAVSAVAAATGAGSVIGRIAGAVLWIIQVASFAAMRSQPGRATAVSLAAGVGLQALWPSLGVLGVANVSICVLAMLRPPRVSLWALGFALVLAPWPAVTRGALAGVIAAGGPILAWSWGELWRARRERRLGEARRAVADERIRIARELHDVVAHNVSLMVVQAVAGEDVFDRHPEQARAALGAIASSGRAALAELRRLLDTIRPESDDERDAPQPHLDQLTSLVDTVRAAGLEASVSQEGSPIPLPAGVELSAYRIVQEALTNALRHARARRIEVALRYTATAVELEVRDDGRGATGSIEGGHGIVGMRERAALVGGVLEAGSAPHGGFRVRAVLPTERGR